jgi:hypothetical protein
MLQYIGMSKIREYEMARKNLLQKFHNNMRYEPKKFRNNNGHTLGNAFE